MVNKFKWLDSDINLLMDEENENRFNYEVRGRCKGELNDSLESEIKGIRQNFQDIWIFISIPHSFHKSWK